ncbi:MAG: PD-(D/E)XK nuclease family protein [Propionibacteriaceae bacterium]|jgi:superfamily I DNA/RNA helicase/RecB family exonuclease|nr:PD-(D/E)XK nuclease family protein [Propionibacteriaceae bacterium]
MSVVRLVREATPETPVLSAAQQQVMREVLQATGSVLLTGEPGCGKTTVLTALVRELVSKKTSANQARQAERYSPFAAQLTADIADGKTSQNGVELSEIVLLTGSRQLAQQLRRQVLSQLEGAHLKPRITTVYGWCRALLGLANGAGEKASGATNSWSAHGFSVTPTLLSAPEQQWRIAELLQAYPLKMWPERFQQASQGSSFPAAVREVLTLAQQRGLRPADLSALGSAGQGDEWMVLGRFFAEYLDVSAAEGVIDYAEAVTQANLLLATDAAQLLRDVRYVLVDEATTLTPAAITLLGTLHRVGVRVVAFADPTTAVQQFQGASERFITDFTAALTDTPGRTLTQLTLNTTPNNRKETATHPARLTSHQNRYLANDVLVRCAPNLEVRDLRLASWLRAEHASGLRWQDMAVIVPGGVAVVSAVARALTTAGVPVQIDSKGSALADEPVVRWLLERLERLITTDDPQLRAGASVESVLWREWSATGWAKRLQTEALTGGFGANRANADLDAAIALFDLAAKHGGLAGESGVRIFAKVVARQVVAADNRKESGQRDAVELLSPVASHGRFWKAIALLDVVEGKWPAYVGTKRLFDLDAALSGVCDPVTERLQSIELQRRAFRLALSRATQVCYVDCTPDESDAAFPSRFLDEFGLPLPTNTDTDRWGVTFEPTYTAHSQQLTTHTARRSLPEFVAELRAVSSNPAQPVPLRENAVAVLRRLYRENGLSGESLVPEADPLKWWGVAGLTHAEVPVTPADEPLRLSASALGLLLSCPRSWFLQQRAGGTGTRGLAAAVGTALHRLFELDWVAQQSGEPLTAKSVTDYLTTAWENLPYRCAAMREAGLKLAKVAFERYSGWRDGRIDRSSIAAERSFRLQLSLPNGMVILTGKVDRVESNAAGQAVVIDFKTGKHIDMNRYGEQLACYELAVAMGALGADVPLAVANAELVWPYLAPRSLNSADIGCRVSLDVGELFEFAQPELPLTERAAALLALLERAVELLRAERFDAVPGKQCVGCAFARGCPAMRSGVVSDEE